MPYDDDEYIFDDAGIDDMPVFPESRWFAGLDNYEKMSLRDYIRSCIREYRECSGRFPTEHELVEIRKRTMGVLEEDWHITLKNDKQWRQFFQDNVKAAIAKLQKETEGNASSATLRFFFRLLLLQQMRQGRIVLYALQFIGYDLPHIGFDPVVVLLYHFFHAVLAVLVREIGNDGYGLVGFLLPFYFFSVHDNLAVKNLLLDALVEGIRHRTHEHSLCKPRNLRGRDKRIHLCVDGCGRIVTVDCNALPFLQNLAKPFGERLRRFPDHLPGEDIADGIHHVG